MKVRQSIGSLLKIAALAACAYLIFNWSTIRQQGDDVAAFAESACVDATRARYDVTGVKAYDVDKTNNGYTVRISVTLPHKGTAAKVTCVTSEQGGVRDIMIDER